MHTQTGQTLTITIFSDFMFISNCHYNLLKKPHTHTHTFVGGGEKAVNELELLSTETWTMKIHVACC